MNEQELPVDPSSLFLGLLRGATRFERTRSELLRLVHTQPIIYLPIAVACALEDQDGLGAVAVGVLIEAVGRITDGKALLSLCEMIPRQSVVLSPVAVAAFGGLVSAIDRGDFRSNPHSQGLKGVTLFFLSDWLLMEGRPAEAVARCEEALRLISYLSPLDHDLNPSYICAVIALSKALWFAGDHDKALERAEAAAQLAQELAEHSTEENVILYARASASFADLLRSAGRNSQALIPSKEAFRVFSEANKLGLEVKDELATACHRHAAVLSELGKDAQALPYSRKAFELFRSLVAQNRDHHLQYYLQSSLLFGNNLASKGESKLGARIIQSTLGHIRALARQSSNRFLSDYVTHLIFYSATRALQGDGEEALRAAKLALSEARRLRRILGVHSLFLEAEATERLSERESALGHMRQAKFHALAAVELFEKLDTRHPDRAVHLARSLCALGALLRRGSNSRNHLVTAISATKRARRIISKVDVHRSEKVIELAANCDSTLGDCLADFGALKSAARVQRLSVEKRRILFEKRPALYREGLFVSLFYLSQYEHKCGRPAEALPLITECLRHCAFACKHSKVERSLLRLEGVYLKAVILIELKQERGALRCLRAAVKAARNRLNEFEADAKQQEINILKECETLINGLDQK